MKKQLVIAEKPSVAADITKALGGFIQRDDYFESPTMLIAACPDNDWRLTFALPRYAGLRFPSEVYDFKWSDIDWENSRFTVRQKKLEHHSGRATRTVPIFAELRPHLERAFRERAVDAVYVLPRVRATTELSAHAKRLVTKAGVKLWPKLFVNMRGSCSDDLERRGVTEKAINAWIGNTSRIRQRHYHAVRAEDWAAVTGVAGNPAPIPAPSAAVRSRQPFTKPAKNRYTSRRRRKLSTPGRDR